MEGGLPGDVREAVARDPQAAARAAIEHCIAVLQTARHPQNWQELCLMLRGALAPFFWVRSNARVIEIREREEHHEPVTIPMRGEADE